MTELIQAPIANCVHSRFNTRKTRTQEQVVALANRIKRNGFEATRALWAVQENGYYEVFAGGTRLESARIAELESVPVFIYSGIADDQISRLADQDNENDEYHAEVPLPDKWAEYHRLNKEEGWTQQRIADAKGCDQPTVARRIKWHTSLCDAAREAVCDGKFDEGHLIAFDGVVCDITYFARWLTTSQAQKELVAEVLGKHRGIKGGIKPTVEVVRKAAKRWKDLIEAAEAAVAKLAAAGDAWVVDFVKSLAKERVRTIAAVNAMLGEMMLDVAAARKAAIESLSAEEEAARKEAERVARIARLTACVVHGDSRELISSAPAGFHLLLTDPPYGMDYQSQRRKVTAKKDRIANDGTDDAISLIADVLTKAFPLMAGDSTALVFTGWRHEPEIRRVIESAGFAVRGSLVWVKNNHGTGDLAGAFAPKHERIIHAVKGNPKLFGSRPDDVLDGKDVQNSEHPTEKPRDLLARLIEATTGVGETVVDPFAGSGGTLLEAYRLKRLFFGIELDEGWYRRVVDAVYAAVQEDNCP